MPDKQEEDVQLLLQEPWWAVIYNPEGIPTSVRSSAGTGGNSGSGALIYIPTLAASYNYVVASGWVISTTQRLVGMLRGHLRNQRIDEV